jgi:hypothetical protein
LNSSANTFAKGAPMSLDEKNTIKATVIASLISALVLFVLTTQWIHHGDIQVLKTNQASVLKHLDDYNKVPAQLARIEALLEANAIAHDIIMKRLK